MAWQELTKAEIRTRWPGEMSKEILKGVKGRWRVEINGGYARMICDCENSTTFSLPKTPGRGAASKAKVIRDNVAGCPDKHRRMGGNFLKRQ